MTARGLTRAAQAAGGLLGLLWVFAIVTQFTTTAAAGACAADTADQSAPHAAGALVGSEIPPRLIPIYEAAAVRYSLGTLGPAVLAAINRIETDFGRNLNTSSAGAQGWMQFIASTWATYGVDADRDGRRDPNSPPDAIYAAANYLRASGAPTDWRKAIFAYNHADWYVTDVLTHARRYQAAAAVTTPNAPSDPADNATGAVIAPGPPPTAAGAIRPGAGWRGAGSLYGWDLTPGHYYRDPGDRNNPALAGHTNQQPAIAIFNSQTLGGWWALSAPNQRAAVLQQTDVGPSANGRDGNRRTVDINAVAARTVFGYSPSAFPTDSDWTVVFLGMQQPTGAITTAPDRPVQPGAQTARTASCAPCPTSAENPPTDLAGDGSPGGPIPDRHGAIGFTIEPGKDYTKGQEPELARRLDAIGRALGIRLTGISGYRTPARSIEVGGFANDPHTRGEASDTSGAETIPQATLRRFGLERPLTTWNGRDERDHITLLPGSENQTGYVPSATATAAAACADPGLGDTQIGARIVRIAQSQLGVSESPPGSNCTPYGPCDQWCAMFTTWVWARAGLPAARQTSNYFVPTLNQWARAHGLFRAAGSQPSPGDMALWPGHVAIVEKVLPDGQITTINPNGADGRVSRRGPAQPSNGTALGPGQIVGYIHPSDQSQAA
jgi:hypothetical protein